MTQIAPIPREPLQVAKRRRVSPATRMTVAARQNWRCTMCRRLMIDGFHIDHVIPLDLGGADNASNMQALDPACHAKKTALDIIAIAKSRRIRFREAGGKKPGAGQIRSRGFSKWEPPE